MSRGSRAVPVENETWRRATARLVHDAGRARLHQLRNALNAAAIGVELLIPDAGSDERRQGEEPGRAVHKEIGLAGRDAAGLQSLFAEVEHPSLETLSDAVWWALEMAGPVAHRRAVTLMTVPSADDVPDVDVPAGLNVGLALLLTEICLHAPRGTHCAVSVDARATGLRVDWRADAVPGDGIDLAQQALAAVLGTDACSPGKESDRYFIALSLRDRSAA